jgi:hypothetical protein
VTVKTKKQTVAASADDFQMEKIISAARYAHGMAVVASPFIGIRDDYDNSDLIVNLPSINNDLRLLQQRQALENYAIQHNEKMPSVPLLDLSGSVETQAFYNDYNYNNNNSASSDIDLSRAELDAVAEIGPYTTAAMILSYDNSQLPSTAIAAAGARVNSSRVQLDRAFITIGNLNKAPVYFTIGQNYVPFGKYSYVMLSDPLPKILGQTKERTAALAFYKEGFYGSIYGYKGDTNEVNHNGDIINQGGVNFGYKSKPFHGMTAEVGGGYILNMADSSGFQNRVFGISPIMPYISFESIQHNVPAIDAYASLDFSKANLGFMAEYISATKAFDPMDISFNHNGAKPSALDVEGVYRFEIGGKKCNFGLAYDKSWEALGIGLPYGLPQQSYIATINTSLWKYTIETLEFRHNVAYGRNDIASFKNSGDIQLPSTISRDQNIVTLQIGVYF